MPVRLNQTYRRHETWVPLLLVTGDTNRSEVGCELRVKRPTFSEQVTAKVEEEIFKWTLRDQPFDDQRHAAMLEHQRARIKLTISDWRGVTTNADASGQEPVVIPYSLPMLELLCSQYPQLLSELDRIINDLLVTYPGDLEKNLPSPPVAGGTDVPNEITPLMGSSISGISSSIASDSATS